MLGSISPKSLESMVGRLRKLEDRLGEDHDLAVLEKLLSAERERFGGKRVVKRVVSVLVLQGKKLRRTTAVMGKEIFRENPRKFADKLGKQWALWRTSVR
jgi:hypothetical protein